MLAGLMVAGWLGQKDPDLDQRLQMEAVEVAGYHSCLTDDGVLALENDHALVYLKPPVPFYGADHYPEICWRAGGFKVRAPEKAVIDGVEMMVARLENEELRLYTAWWYDNGPVQTTSTFRWRWDQLRGEPGFFLVNVTVAEEEELECAVMEWRAGAEGETGKMMFGLSGGEFPYSEGPPLLASTSSAVSP
jgi:hypothetical protein